MPKRAQFAPGFPELRGNVSGKQNLVYPTKDNKAYEGPVGSKNYARNYRPSVIVSQRMRDGGFQFAIRLRSANHLTEKSKTAMALLGGAGAIYAAIQKVATLNLRTHSSYTLKVTQGYSGTYRKYVMDILREGLSLKAASFSFPTATGSVSVDNPWVVTSATPNIEISVEILVKFWTELANDPILFYVLGNKGIAHSGETFDELIESNHNNLGLTKTEEDGWVKYGDSFLENPAGATVSSIDEIQANAEYVEGQEP